MDLNEAGHGGIPSDIRKIAQHLLLWKYLQGGAPQDIVQLVHKAHELYVYIIIYLP